MEENQVPVRNEAQVPWSLLDTWVGVGLLALINAGLLAGLFLFREQAERLMQGAGIILAELIYLLPVLLIFGWRRISFGSLGFTKFDSATMGLGCGLLIAAYGVVMAHNLLLMFLGVDTQGEAIFKALSELENPAWLLIVGVLVAPLVEEIFFRGFLFQGFRQRYGWIPALALSSVIFAAAHLDPVSFIPTFVLGAVMAYVYHRSNSIWPGILLHFLNNGFALCAALAATRIPGLIPS
jgi:hypothetical protein